MLVINVVMFGVSAIHMLFESQSGRQAEPAGQVR
jgi:hypothetical protein